MAVLFVGFRALLFGTAFVWLWSWVALSALRLDARIGFRLPAATAPVGYVVLAAGAVLAATCVALVVIRGHGTPAPFDAPRTFVALGPYSIVRNPMYVGAWLVIVGFGLAERSVAVVAFSALWLALAHTFVIAYEERALASKFGASYREYCRRVPRWLPTPGFF
jgi:protein-S-isoprenylcysteine O-methyltransferase Ste14